MQPPLTPQRGRIESNPREYTHMGPRFCSELTTMQPDWAKAPRDRRASVEIWTLAKREWIFGRKLNESGFSDGISLKTPKNRPIIHPHALLTYLSSLTHL